MSIVSNEMDLPCDFYPFFKRMLLRARSFLSKLLSKVTNSAELKYSSQHWIFMKQILKNIAKIFQTVNNLYTLHLK